MTDLFAAAQVEAPPQEKPDLSVRWRRIPDSTGHYLFHPCSVCGSTEAWFGEGVSFRNGTSGRWWCWAHWREHVAEREARR